MLINFLVENKMKILMMFRLLGFQIHVLCHGSQRMKGRLLSKGRQSKKYFLEVAFGFYTFKCLGVISPSLTSEAYPHLRPGVIFP